MNDNELRKRIDDLKISAAFDLELHDKSRRTTYKTLADAYINWRDAIKEVNWLENEYKRCGIKYRKVDNPNNNINFRPYIRLIYNFIDPTPYQQKLTTEYHIVLNALDREFVENKDQYQTNVEGKLAVFLEQKGGINGVINEYRGVDDGDDVEFDEDKNTKSLLKKKLNENELAQRSIGILSNTSTKGIATTKPLHHVRADDNNLVVMIGRREKNGSVTILGTTNEKQAIDIAAIHTTKRNMSLVPYNLRLIAEVVQTQIFPRVGIPKTEEQYRIWYNRIFLDKTGILYNVIANKKLEDVDRDNNNLSNPRSLLLRGDKKDLLFSALRSKRSVVTQCIPKKFIGDYEKRIYLKTEQRGTIEDYISVNEIELFDTFPQNSLIKIDNQKYIYKMTVKNKVIHKQRDFHFYDYYRSEIKSKMKQQTIFDFDAYFSDWSGSVDVVWFEELRAIWLDEWFTKLGRYTQLKRENNLHFNLSISSKKIKFTYNIDKTGLAPFQSMKTSIKLNDNIKEYTAKFRSKELAPVLYNIADLEIKGKVKISGNDDALVFEFNTDVGSYKIAVPAIISKTQRSCFSLRD